jgi:hypothetical protein
LRDESLKKFEIDFEKHLKSMRFDIKIGLESWSEIKSEMNAEASNDEIT